jgi:PAS domain S-box-containing protein
LAWESAIKMVKMKTRPQAALLRDIEELRSKLNEANDTLEAIRAGQIDALVVSGDNGHTLFTLESADVSYRIFIEKMTEGAVTLSPSGVILYCNSRFASMVHRPLARVLGCPFDDFIVERCKADFRTIFERAWEKDIKREFWISAAGEEIPVQLSLTSLALQSGKTLSVIVTDVSFQKDAEHQLQIKNEQLEVLNEALAKSNHDLQQFASVASHDLQEPLRKIQVFCSFLKEKGVTEIADPSGQYLEKIISSASRMKMLILDILNYSRLSADDPKIEPLNLNAIFDEIIDDFEILIKEKNACVAITSLPIVEGNRGQLRQVFQNLVSNALKFSKPGAAPSISIDRKDVNAHELGLSLPNEKDYCRISVKDNGIGFKEHYASSIFNLFEKLNPKSAYEGSGIGLAIAKKIIEKHHGVIIAKSAEGEGAEFNIILPYKRIDHHDD